MRALVDIRAVGALWFLRGSASPWSIRWFDKVAPLGISRLALNGRKAPSIYRNGFRFAGHLGHDLAFEVRTRGHWALIPSGRSSRLETTARYRHCTGFDATRGATFFAKRSQISPRQGMWFKILGSQVAEMSPDERYLAALVLHWPKDASPTAEFQLWGFRGCSRRSSLPTMKQKPRFAADGRPLSEVIA